MFQLSPRLRARLERVPDVARAAAAAEMEKFAEEVVEAMKAAAPVDGGDLRDSIGWTWGDVPAGSFTIADVRSGKNKGDQYATLRINIYAGSKDAFYARFIEFGTKTGVPAQPFFFPIWAKMKKGYKARISRAVKAAIKQGLSNG